VLEFKDSVLKEIQLLEFDIALLKENIKTDNCRLADASLRSIRGRAATVEQYVNMCLQEYNKEPHH